MHAQAVVGGLKISDLGLVDGGFLTQEQPHTSSRDSAIDTMPQHSSEREHACTSRRGC